MLTPEIYQSLWIFYWGAGVLLIVTLFLVTFNLPSLLRWPILMVTSVLIFSRVAVGSAGYHCPTALAWLLDNLLEPQQAIEAAPKVLLQHLLFALSVLALLWIARRLFGKSNKAASA